MVPGSLFGNLVPDENLEIIYGSDGNFFTLPSQITRRIEGTDTMINEMPQHSRFLPINVKIRKGTNTGTTSREEFDILNRRFNEAESVSKKK